MRMLRTGLALFAVCCLPWIFASCLHLNCTEMGCLEGVQLALESPLEEGEYRFVVEADGWTVICDATFPLSKEIAFPCRSNGEEGWVGDLSLWGGEEPILTLHRTPKSLWLRVTKDDAIVHAGIYRPAYERQFPNGEECDSGCLNAKVSVILE